MARGGVTKIEGEERSREEAYRSRHASFPAAGTFGGLLAEGGMGAVLLADLPGGEGGRPRRAVVKVLRDDLLSDPRAAARFRREVATVKKVSDRFQSPRVVPCLGVIDSDDPARLHIFQPFYPDGSLVSFMGAGGAVDEGLRILADAVEGLQGLHGHGYLHRDFCPHNILVGREGGAPRGLLGDLGVAVPLDGNTVFSDALVAAELELRVGHRGYVAPEGASPVGADLFGVGATLYWLIAGTVPRSVTGDAPLLLPARGDCRAEVDAGLHRRSAEAVERLTRHAEDGGVRTAVEARDVLVQVLDAVGARAGARAETNHASRARRWPVVVALLVVLGTAGSFVAFRFGRAGEAGPAASVSLPRSLQVDARPAQKEFEPGLSVPKASAPKSSEADRARVSSPKAAPSPEIDVDAALAAARGQIARGDVAAAEKGLRALLADSPGQPDASGLLALLRSRGGEAGMDEAVRILEKALVAAPARGDLRLALAKTFAARGRADEGVQTLAAAPAKTTYARDIAVARVTLERVARRSR